MAGILTEPSPKWTSLVFTNYLYQLLTLDILGMPVPLNRVLDNNNVLHLSLSMCACEITKRYAMFLSKLASLALQCKNWYSELLGFASSIVL